MANAASAFPHASMRVRSRSLARGERDIASFHAARAASGSSSAFCTSERPSHAAARSGSSFSASLNERAARIQS
jgi:hypothetical protein